MRTAPIVAMLSAVALVTACSQEHPTSVPTTVTPTASAAVGAAWLITTYYWNDGWVEHASWNDQFLGPDLQIWFLAGNGGPEYPALQVELDNVYAFGDTDLPEALVDDFNGGVTSDVWSGGGGECVSGRGVDACVVAGVLTVDVEAGQAGPGLRRVVALNTTEPVIHGEFDVQIDFSLSDRFHSASSAAVSLSVGYEQDHHAEMNIFPGRYESREEDWQGYSKRIRWTPTSDLEGKLRITRTRARPPEEPGADVLKDGGCSVNLYPLGPSYLVPAYDMHMTITPNGNMLFECRAELPDWVEAPDQAYVKPTGSCSTRMGRTYQYHKVFTPTGDINLRCWINPSDN